MSNRADRGTALRHSQDRRAPVRSVLAKLGLRQPGRGRRLRRPSPRARFRHRLGCSARCPAAPGRRRVAPRASSIDERGRPWRTRRPSATRRRSSGRCSRPSSAGTSQRLRELAHPDYVYTGTDGVERAGVEAGRRRRRALHDGLPRPELRGPREPRAERRTSRSSSSSPRGTHTGPLDGIPPTGKRAEVVGLQRRRGRATARSTASATTSTRSRSCSSSAWPTADEASERDADARGSCANRGAASRVRPILMATNANRDLGATGGVCEAGLPARGRSSRLGSSVPPPASISPCHMTSCRRSSGRRLFEGLLDGSSPPAAAPPRGAAALAPGGTWTWLTSAARERPVCGLCDGCVQRSPRGRADAEL